ncbi:MAG: M20/M25/M40 family metallo-hydrolase [Bacteroidales bacterium]|nr:M20/M25/M40 family metallo-hydrolase [Bacteroidales bacterium]
MTKLFVPLQKNNEVMKKIYLTLIFIIPTIFSFAQIPHLYNHTFPQVDSQNPKVNEMLEQVDVANIQNYVEDLTSFINRRCDGSHIWDVKDWLVEKYSDFSLNNIQLFDFQVISYWDTIPKPFTTAPNVLAIQIGKTKPEEYIICGAHYDSWVNAEEPYDVDTLRSPGADDNASGVAGILETARILSNYDFERTIIYANWNAEEMGLCGSNEYAKQCQRDSLDIVAYFNLDMTGYVNPDDFVHIHLLYTPCDSLLGNFVKQVSHTYLPEINICQAWLMHGDTDYSSFNRHGYQAISPSEDVNYLSPYIHTVDDIIGLSVNSWEQAEVFTKLNLTSVAIAAGPLFESVDEIDDKDVLVESYEVFDIFGRPVLSEKNVWKNMEEIPVTDLQTGIYIMRFFMQDGNVVTKKFIKR